MVNARSQTRQEWATGWPILLMAFIGIFWHNIITYPIGVLVKPIAETWGWSRGEATLLLSFHALVTLLLGSAAGTLGRRLGVFRLAFGALLLAAIGLVFVGLSGPNLMLWYAAWTWVAVAQLGCTVIVWAYALTATFDRTRGLALAVAMCGSGAAAAILPPLTLALYERGGIAGAYIGLSGLMLLTSLPLIIWMLISGRKVEPAREAGPAGPASPIAAAEGLTLAQAIRTRTFWLLAIGMLLVAGCVSSIIVHFQSLITDRGVSRVTAAWLASLLGPSLIVGRLVTGVLLDRLSARTIVLLVFAFPLVASAILATFTGSVPLAIVAIVFTGLAAGAEGDMLAYFASRYFGVGHFGAIYGLLMGVFGIGFGGFPAATGFLFDLLGSYNMAFTIMGTLLLLGATCLFLMGNYPKRGEAA